MYKFRETKKMMLAIIKDFSVRHIFEQISAVYNLSLQINWLTCFQWAVIFQ